MKRKELLKWESNSTVWKKVRRRYEAKLNCLCWFCKPNRGCNQNYSKHIQRSWKKYRKKQWKVILTG